MKINLLTILQRNSVKVQKAVKDFRADCATERFEFFENMLDNVQISFSGFRATILLVSAVSTWGETLFPAYIRVFQRSSC